MLPLDTTTIAVILAVFFLVAALINTLVNRSKRRRIENLRAAQTGDGTEEAPIHLTTPFTEGQAAAAPSPFAPGNAVPPAASADAAASGEAKDKDDVYIWE